MKPSRNSGFTLMEMMIAIFILQLVVGPLYLAFSGSRRMMINAREWTKAVSFAGSMIAGLRKIETKKIPEIALTPEGSLPEAISLSNLGLTAVPEGFQRFLVIGLVDEAAQEGGPFFEARVEIRWKNFKQPKAPELVFSMKSLLGRKES